ncbi:MAG TPA: glucosaminidase domain-containing protein [Acidimicrobiales bacterium]|jgi:flagellum-specific peptidoglycan hydrolase FlgJ|nr:glucosaminidase domain-containing protein [Acidimicrobiales bacterium]
MNHDGPIGAAQASVDAFRTAIAGDQRTIAADQHTQVSATATMDTANARLAGDRDVLARATTTLHRADALLAADRARLSGIALSVYTGELTDPEAGVAVGYHNQQQQELDFDQVEVVAHVIDGHLHTDFTADQADARSRSSASAQVGLDITTAASAQQAARAAAAQTALETQILSADESRLAGARGQLARAQASLSVDLAEVVGTGAPDGQLSLIGGPALTTAQLVSWFDYEGYVDLTSAPIGHLAQWYIDYGRAEGVRGDVAFAQAVLETGGFSSPDAAGLSNFAGIGHCDTCSAGWTFPSPQLGVLGQIQLLRIFADKGPGPSGSPAPVLPDLTVANQFKAGCCATVQSLTGVWATDPTYGQQITGLYAQMLGFSLSAGPTG